MSVALCELQNRMASVVLRRQIGRVTQVVGDVVEADLPSATVGATATIGDVTCEVIGFKGTRVLLMPLESLVSVSYGSPVLLNNEPLSIPVGEALLGRVIDPLGVTLDGKPITGCKDRRPLECRAPSPLKRQRITRSMQTGVRAIDGFLNLGVGQRVALVAGSGVGKSTLLGMLARESTADVNVVALVGERGREVREFLERDLGPEGLKKTVAVVSSSDSSPLLQIKCVQSALSIAEYFRDQGKDVLLLVDSLTRMAMAKRQIGLAAGEPPTTRGYTPSVFTMMPRILERAGPGATGGITAVCTVLVEGDDIHDPVADMVRGIVDGHIILSRKLATHGHYPPIDVLESLSRTMEATVDGEHASCAARLRDVLATYRENEEIIRLGAYRKGTSVEVDRAILLKPKIDTFLKQDMNEVSGFDETQMKLRDLTKKATPVKTHRQSGSSIPSPHPKQ